MTQTKLSAKDVLMRYTPVAAALSLFVAVTSSVGWSEPREELDPRAAALLADGRADFAKGDYDGAIDAYEAALVLQPGSVPVLVNLAEVRRKQGMQGKALHYYRDALAREPKNLAAIAGEGAALAEKGATEKAQRNLARLKGLCGDDCTATRQLATALSRGVAPRVLTAEAVTPEPVVSDN
ncbi:hypothetical protein GCM10011371_02320 [Novosphingobium marinum]|uniref:Tetratricopeptide (TPR) repeat protein n=1 Tax=Novosphingobium marinum TaxID=1514948 RepID=A0A7Y9XSW8_9SPHN|nr:tetratricopeptide repeat protein [Novosphingobium marinum]NYH93924.1 tetratricopeptide (TPR) repeat protein [Novosphingobium marinum]GGC18334.1 hypothetical protein GCM10011371_02320 [Novosphingobium marinum]